jgi:hypothetical protein
MSAVPDRLPDVPAWVSPKRSHQPSLHIAQPLDRERHTLLIREAVIAVIVAVIALALGAVSANWVWLPGHSPERITDVMTRYDMQAR